MVEYQSRMIGVSNFVAVKTVRRLLERMAGNGAAALFLLVCFENLRRTKTLYSASLIKEREVLFVYAVIQTGGKQYKVQEGDIIFVEKLGVEANEKVSFDVVAISDDNGIKTGTPLVDGVKVSGTVLRNAKAKKIVVFKYKSKKNEKKKQGHRQPYSKVQIDKIG